jgi:hypothetical protein
MLNCNIISINHVFCIQKKEWQTIIKKEKNQPAPKPEPIVMTNNSKPEGKREKSKDRDFINEKNDNAGPRNRRDRGPPRFQRGRLLLALTRNTI